MNNSQNSIRVAERANQMLQQMISLYIDSKGKTARPNLDSFRLVLMGYASLRNIIWTREGQEIINDYRNDGNANGDDGDHDFVCAADRMESVLQQLNMLQKMEDVDETDKLDLDTDVLNIMLKGYARCTQQYVPVEVDTKRLSTNFSSSSSSSHQYQLPWLVSSSGRQTYAERAEQTLLYMIQQSELQRNNIGEDSNDDDDRSLSNIETIQPNSKSYGYVIDAWSRQQSNCRRYLESMDTLVTSESSLPTANFYHHCKLNNIRQTNHHIRTILNQNDMFIKRVGRWLLNLESMYKEACDASLLLQNEFVEEDACPEESLKNQKIVHDYRTVMKQYHSRRELRQTLQWAYGDSLDAWARCGVDQSTKNSDDLMRKIQQLSEDDIEDLERIKKFVSVDKGSVVKDSSSAQLSSNGHDDELFSTRSTSHHPSQNDDNWYIPKYSLHPSSQSYTSAILALSRDKQVKSAKRAHQLLDEMMALYDSGSWGRNKPSLLAFNYVILSWTHCSASGSADKAESVLKQLENFHFDGEKKYQHLKPDKVSYNLVITAWQNSKDFGAVVNCEKWLRRMEVLSNEIGDKFLDVPPDKFAYNSCIIAWIRSDMQVKSALNAERLLRKMVQNCLEYNDETLEPNQKIFSAVINAWAKCGEKSLGVQRAVSLLNTMESLHDKGMHQMKPDIISYTVVIDAIARSDMPNSTQLAFKTLDKIEQMYMDGDKAMKPTVRTYSCVLLSLMRTRQPDIDKEAESILHRMEKVGVKPNAFTYNYVINCASSMTGNDERKKEAFQIATKAFKDLRASSNEVDSFTYSFFLKACKNLLPENELQSKIFEQTFCDCCKRGHVNQEVLQRLSRCLRSPDDISRILDVRLHNKRDIVDVEIPCQWGRNVKR